MDDAAILHAPFQPLTSHCGHLPFCYAGVTAGGQKHAFPPAEAAARTWAGDEMTEHILAFAALIIGLGVADMLISFHRLLRARQRVRWDWLALSFAAMALVLPLVEWWWSFSWIHRFAPATIAGFVPLFVFLSLGFLLMAAALPDEVPERGIDLREFYLSSRVHLWTLVLLLALLNVAADFATWGVPEVWGRVWPIFISVAVALCAIMSRKAWVSALAIAWGLGFIIVWNILLPVLR